MVYSWDDKEAECYKLYVEERRNLEEVMSYWEMRGFTPRCVSCATAVYGLPYTSRGISYGDERDGEAVDTISAAIISNSDGYWVLFCDADYVSANARSSSSSNDGISPASRTPDTRTPRLPRAYTNYGSRTTPRRTWWIHCRLRASRSTTVN
jgi:hypothetical protein